MAERILSPSVYITENDQSFNAPGLGVQGACFVGPTQKGRAFAPTQVTSYSDFVSKFGPETPYSYIPYAVRNYLMAGGVATVTRILGNGGWRFDGSTKKLAAITSGSKIIAAFHPSNNINPSFAELSSTALVGTFQQFNFTISGSQVSAQISASLNPASNYYVTKTLGTSQFATTSSAFTYLLFGNYFSASVAIGSASFSATPTLILSSTPCTFTSSNVSGYNEAITPWIISPAGVRLFRIHHRSQGDYTNTDIKICLNDITISTTSGIDSTFSLIVRQYGDTDNVPSVLEQYTNLTVNANTVDSSYIAQAIGNKYKNYDPVQQKVIEYGDYDDVSNYIRIEVSNAVANGALDSTVYPAGFEAVYETITGFSGYGLPTASYIQSTVASNTYSGFDYTNVDNLNYLNPIPLEATQGGNATFFVTGSDNKFIVPMQGGIDGMNYAQIQNTGTAITANNLFGFDLSSPTAGGALSYIQALNILSSTDIYQFNLLCLPGVLQSLHPSVTSYAISTVTNRADSMYILDLCGASDTIATAISTVSAIDSNYTATYYPWLKIVDSVTNKIVPVPPSCIIPQVIAYNDSVAAPWFAPAGINRGGIGGVKDVMVKLYKSDRDLLYPASINPIASFPNTGIAVWGQKTLQVKASALDRINVRRLLLDLKAVFNNAARNIIFDPSTTVTWNKFKNSVTPYMSMVQSKQGLYAFKIIMDDTNNTPDVIDRNIIVGAIYLQPVKAGEFIELTFNIEPTGASFS